MYITLKYNLLQKIIFIIVFNFSLLYGFYISSGAYFEMT